MKKITVMHKISNFRFSENTEFGQSNIFWSIGCDVTLSLCLCGSSC